jgi:hypothetical protein
VRLHLIGSNFFLLLGKKIRFCLYISPRDLYFGNPPQPPGEENKVGVGKYEKAEYKKWDGRKGKYKDNWKKNIPKRKNSFKIVKIIRQKNASRGMNNGMLREGGKNHWEGDWAKNINFQNKI